MKVRVGDLRKAIREDYMRGVPEFVLRQATEKYVEEIRRHVFSFIRANKSGADSEQRNAIAAANEVLEELETKANELLEEQLWNFLRNV